MRSHQRAGAIEVEAGPAAKEELGVEAAEDEVGVGDGGPDRRGRTDGPGHGAGGLGADAEEAAGVEAGEGAAARAGGVDVEHGDADGHAGDDGLDGGLRAAFAGVDEQDVGGGAAHVEADDAVEAGELRDAQGADDAAGGPGEDGADGLVRGYSGRRRCRQRTA